MKTIAILVAALAWASQGAASGAAEAYLANAPFTTRSASVSTVTDLAAAKASALANTQRSRSARVARSRCPQSCSDVGLNPSDWYMYNRQDRLNTCNNTMLLDFHLANNIDDPETHVNIAACSADLELTSNSSSTTINATCQSEGVQQNEVTSSLQLATSGSSTSSANVSDIVAALDQLRILYTVSEPACDETINFAYSGTAAVGVYVGSGLAKQAVIASVLEQLTTQVQSTIAENIFVQLCDNSSARYSLGVYINTNADFASVQRGLQSWKNGTCITAVNENIAAWQNLTFLAPVLLDNNSSSVNNISTASNLTSLSIRSLHSRDECSTIQVVSGDTCATLAAECGISATNFTTYNSASDVCSSLAVGEHVCCSDGDLPDYSLSAYSNGTCYTYMVVSGDSCSNLAATYDITVADIESYNNDTWGWNGCDDLLAGYNICLSSGDAPMPTTVANAVCGPQVNGTAVAPSGTDLSLLNQCPLNACCNIWGQCGTTADFCTISNSTTGAPGTAAAGENGCISNCGQDVIISAFPDEVFSIAYFEAFDQARPCLTMSVTDVNTSAYTHIHFAFVTLNTDFSINLTTTAVAEQLTLLSNMTDVKRIVSIGGWSFSTDVATYAIFRDAVSTEANRATLISNVVDFLDEYDLDGVDWDWEYPDEPDIAGIPAGTEADSDGYFLLLDELSVALEDTDKTISITAPSSFWYLQQFPIEAISLVVDYIIFMTYDLHGQWDYGNAYSDAGCPDGSCLRSHVNLTETINALSMITKASVPSNMVAVGVTSYARAFEMTTAGCWTEECTFTGPDSGAIAGACTETAGYLAQYELNTIISDDSTAQVIWDTNSSSSILVYNDTQWAAYMNDSNKAWRTQIYTEISFLGTADWAVDLISEDGDSYDEETVYVPPSIWSSSDSNNVACIPPCTIVLPPYQLGTTTTIIWPSLTTTLLSSSGSETYTITTTLSVAPVTTTEIEFWPITFGTTDPTAATVAPVQSVMPPSFVITLPAGIATFPPTQIVTESAAVASASSVSSSTAVAAVFYTTSKTVTIQPQATVSLSSGVSSATNSAGESISTGTAGGSTASSTAGGSSPSKTSATSGQSTASNTSGATNTAGATITSAATFVPSITYSSAKATSTCSGSGCGTIDCLLFGCGDSCGIFGCDGGCGIFGCGTSCGWFGCTSSCDLETCGGLDCITGECGTGGCPSGDCSSWTDTSGAEDAECDSPVTTSVCTEIISSFIPTSQTTYSTTTKTHCQITEGCDVTGSTATTTITTSESYSTYAISLYDGIYSTEPASELSSIASEILSVQSAWDATRWAVTTTAASITAAASASASIVPLDGGITYCNSDSDCSYYSPCSDSAGSDSTCILDENTCGCPAITTSVSIPTTTKTKTTSKTTSASVTATADCSLADNYFAYAIEIYNIEGWSTDGGTALEKQEKGCGTITSWKYTDATDTEDAWASFNIDFFIKSGCIERAIVSAGGPSISCDGAGFVGKRSSSDAPVRLPQTEAEMETLREVYGNRTVDHPHYIPMDWSTANVSATIGV